MKRLFFKLYLILAITNGITLFAVLIASDVLMENVISNFSRHLFKGTLTILMDEFTSKPKDQWNEYLDDLNQKFSFPITLYSFEDLQLSDEERSALEQGKIVYLPSHLKTCQKIPQESVILAFGPVYRYSLVETFLIINAIFLLIGVAFSVFIWVRPIWKSLLTLRQSAIAFGRGKFNTRVYLKKTSIFNQLAITFNLMAERIQQSINTYQELTSSISHELRTPIARLKFGMEMLQNAKDHDSHLRYLEGMNKDVKELDTLVSELLIYAKFDPTISHIDLECRLVLPWLKSILIKEEQNFKGKRFSWTIPNCSKDLIAEFDNRSLQRCISNLIRNAYQYSHSQVEVSLEFETREICLHVDDDGPGIPIKYRQQAFEAFVRLENNHEKQVEGNGLGLAIVKRIITQHNGKVEVSTSPLQGARFSLRLPLS